MHMVRSKSNNSLSLHIFHSFKCHTREQERCTFLLKYVLHASSASFNRTDDSAGRLQVVHINCAVIGCKAKIPKRANFPHYLLYLKDNKKQNGTPIIMIRTIVKNKTMHTAPHLKMLYFRSIVMTKR